METPAGLLRILAIWILVSGCFHSFSARSCQVDGENKKNAKLFVSYSERITKYNLNSYELKGCLQDVLLTRTVELPSPQNFSTESWMFQTATANRHCEIDSTTSPLLKVFKDTSSEAKKLVLASDDCLGLNVQETQQKPISISLSKNCQILSKKSESNLLLKGENCRVSSAGIMNLKIDWVILNSCKSKSEPKSDINLRLRTAEISRAKNSFLQPDVLLEKKLEIVFENGMEEDPRYKMGDRLFTVKKSGKYEIDFDFMSLSLFGSKYTQLRAKSEYLVQNMSMQKSPFVLNHTLYLIKDGKYGSPIQLSHWLSGAYLPPNWMGMDGLSETFNFGSSFESFPLNESALSIQVGDLLVLKTEMSFPNRGPQKFVDFYTEELKKYQKKNPNRENKSAISTKDDIIPEIKPIAGIGELKAIPELDQTWSDPKVAAFAMTPLNPIQYSSYCLDGECIRFDEIESMPEIRVSFLVEESEIGIKFKPVKIMKRNFKNQIKTSDINEMSRVKCL